MGSLYKFYDKNIAEGKSFLVFSAVFALLVRLIYLIHPDLLEKPVAVEGYLWQSMAPFFEDTFFSILFSVFMLALCAFIVGQINKEHVFIRRRTLMPSAIVILLFSCIPSQMVMSQNYIGTLTLLIVLYHTFDSYMVGFKQVTSFKMAFYLSLGSLFATYLLFYLPVLWICLSKARAFNMKVFLASLFGVILIYVPTFSYFVLTDDIAGFIQPFTSLLEVDWIALPILNYHAINYFILGILGLVICVILADNFLYSYKDKVRVRIYLFILTLVVLLSFMCGLFVNIAPMLFLSVGLGVSSLLFGHFFSLAQHRAIIILFFIALLFYLIITTLSFFS